MVETQQVTKVQMLEFYASGAASEFVNVGDKIFAKTNANLHSQFKTVVWCTV